MMTYATFLAFSPAVESGRSGRGPDRVVTPHASRRQGYPETVAGKDRQSWRVPRQTGRISVPAKSHERMLGVPLPSGSAGRVHSVSNKRPDHFAVVADFQASAPPTTGNSIVVWSKSIVNFVPASGHRVKSRSLEKIMSPIFCPAGIT